MLSSYKKVILLSIITILIFFTISYLKKNYVSKNINEVTLNINNKNSIFNLLKNNYLYIEDNYFYNLGILYHFNANKLFTLDYCGNIKIYNINLLESNYNKIVYDLYNCENNESTQLAIYRSKGNKVYLKYPKLLKTSRNLDILNKNQFVNHIVYNNHFSYENIPIKYFNLSKYDINKVLK